MTAYQQDIFGGETPLSELPDNRLVQLRATNVAAARRYRARHPERAKQIGRESQARRRRKGPERVRELAKKWQQENPEKYKASYKKAGKKWRANNPDKHLEIARRWRRANPEKARAGWQRYRKKTGGAKPHRFWPQFYMEQRGRCQICGEPMLDLTAIHVHHIWAVDFDGPTAKWNLCATHASCNLSAGADWDARTLIYW